LSLEDRREYWLWHLCNSQHGQSKIRGRIVSTDAVFRKFLTLSDLRYHNEYAFLAQHTPTNTLRQNRLALDKRIKAITSNNARRQAMAKDQHSHAIVQSGTISGGNHMINLIGQATLRQTAAILKMCNLFVGNDGGPMHLAAAVGTSIIEISCHPKSGSPKHHNSPRRFGPWKVQSTILQPEYAVAPCKDSCLSAKAHCIKSVTAEQVIKAINRQLSDSIHQNV